MAGDSGMSAQLASHIRPFQEDPWEPAVLRRTKLCLLDSLACYSAGRSLPHFGPSSRVARNLFGVGPNPPDRHAPISPFLMAYLYGQAANALDYDDMLLGHPGSPIIGSVLAVATRDRLSVDRLLRGIAAGYEAHWILCAAGAPSRERSALVRSISVWDTVAASIGASVALGLEDDMSERVIGVAVAHSMLPYIAKWYDRPVPALKNNMGWVAAGAVLSIDLAMAGLSGVTAPLDGDTGMWRMVGSDQWILEKQLLEKPAVLRVGFKQYPACWHIQEYLKTFSRLLASMAPDDAVAEIVVTSPREIEKFCPPGISGSADIAFSLPATLNLLISGVEPGPLWDFSDGSGMRHTFRYEHSEHRTILVRTRGGAEMTAGVRVNDSSDLAASGLDEESVIAKHERLTEALLRSEAIAAFAPDYLPAVDSVPDRFYAAVGRLIADEPSESGDHSISLHGAGHENSLRRR